MTDTGDAPADAAQAARPAPATGTVWLDRYPPDVDWAAPLPVGPVPALLDASVKAHGNRPLCDFLDKTFTYRQIGDLADRIARGLQGRGVGKDHRVGLFLPNCPYFIAAYYGILKTGATVVNFNPLYAEQELIKQVTDSGTEIMFTLDLAALHPKLVPLLAKTGLKTIVVCPMTGILPFPKNLLFPIVKRSEVARVPKTEPHLPLAKLTAGPPGKPQPVEIAPDDVAVLQYTGGTTGVPKGAMLTHANITANTEQSMLWFPRVEPGRERVMGVLPFFHVFAMTAVMNLAIRAGAEILMMPKFDLMDCLALIDKKKPTLFPAVPTIYTAINNCPTIGKYDLSSIRFCISGGAGLPVDVKQKFEDLTGCTLVEGYGLTESSPVAAVNPINGVNKPGSIGLPLPGTTIEIHDRETPGKTLGIGERGEICIIGPQVMKGYWNKAEETANTLREGRLHTGDVGYMDAEGYTFIVDRIKDLILAGGYNVYPRTVEEAIYQHPAVEECIVAGIPHEYRGQTVKAFIKLKAGQHLDTDGLIQFLGDKLSPIEMPKEVEFRDDPLPKTMIGKLSRKAILEEDEANRAAA